MSVEYVIVRFPSGREAEARVLARSARGEVEIEEADLRPRWVPKDWVLTPKEVKKMDENPQLVVLRTLIGDPRDRRPTPTATENRAWYGP